MAVILCIETSGDVCSVALFNGSEFLNEKIETEAFRHAAVVTLLIEALLKETDVSMQQLNAVAVSAGPGSYTGLRIGTSVAKGLCYALEIPLIAINSLQSIARFALLHDQAKQCDLIIPVIDARRMEVYTATYNRELTELSAPTPHIIDEESYSDLLNNHLCCFAGSGAQKIAETINSTNATFLPEPGLFARNMGSLAAEKWASSDFEDVAYFEPFYLKEFFTTAPKTKRS